MRRRVFIGTVAGTAISLLAGRCAAATSVDNEFLFLEAEGFDDLGGWEVDQQSMDQMGSAYLLAHGLGRPVNDVVALDAFRRRLLRLPKTPDHGEVFDLVEVRVWPEGMTRAEAKVTLLLEHRVNAVETAAGQIDAVVAENSRGGRRTYRALYSRKIVNLFMAGRDISVTKEGLGPVRVMRTCGMMGEIVGKAAAICVRESTTPRGVYERHLETLHGLMRLRGRLSVWSGGELRPARLADVHHFAAAASESATSMSITLAPGLTVFTIGDFGPR